MIIAGMVSPGFVLTSGFAVSQELCGVSHFHGRLIYWDQLMVLLDLCPVAAFTLG